MGFIWSSVQYAMENRISPSKSVEPMGSLTGQLTAVVRLIILQFLFFICGAEIGTCQYALILFKSLYFRSIVWDQSGSQKQREQEKKKNRGETGLLEEKGPLAMLLLLQKRFSHFLSLLTTSVSGAKRGAQAHCCKAFRINKEKHKHKSMNSLISRNLFTFS